MKVIQVCKLAFKRLSELTEDYKILGYSCDEKRDLDSLNNAKDFYQIIDKYAPDKFLLLIAGRNIDSKLDNIAINYKILSTFNTRDHDFTHVFLPTEVWKRHKAEIMKIDNLWVQEKEAIAKGLAMPIEWKTKAKAVNQWWIINRREIQSNFEKLNQEKFAPGS